MITVKCEFDDTGNPKIDVLGTTGPACRALTKELEDAFGGQKTTTLKREFYDKTAVAQQQEARK